MCPNPRFRLLVTCLNNTILQLEMTTELYRLSATEAIAAIASDKLNVESYARSLLGHIKERDPSVKAWAYLDEVQVLQQARALDNVPKDERGPLHGVAVGIKDVILTKGRSEDSSCRNAADMLQACQHSTTPQSTQVTSPKSMLRA